MENILTFYSILSMGIVLTVTSILSVIPIKGIQKLSQPISIILVMLAPFVVSFVACWLIYKISKFIFMRRAKIRNFFLTHDQKVQMLENLYNRQDAIHA